MEIASEHKKYKSGYCMVATTVQDLESFGWLQQCVAQCEEFTLGIPDEWTIARLYGDRVEYHAEQMQEYWRQSGWFTDVIILDAEHLMYQKAYEKYLLMSAIMVQNMESLLKLISSLWQREIFHLFP